jgi:hypothetical protein
MVKRGYYCFFMIQTARTHETILTSAMMPMHPAIVAALAWAPLIPPKPDVRKTLPAKSSVPKYFLAALRTVN